MIERYTRKQMGRIWEPEMRFRKWLEVEIAACEAPYKKKDEADKQVGEWVRKADDSWFGADKPKA